DSIACCASRSARCGQRAESTQSTPMGCPPASRMATVARLGPSPPHTSGEAEHGSGRWGPPLALIAAAVLVTLVAHRQTALGMVELWRRSSTYAYAWLVLPAIFFLLWHNRARLARVRPTCSLS